MRRLTGGSRAHALAIYLPLAYLMISWYPHINLHQSTEFSFANILAIDYGFHVPLFIAAGLLIWGFMGLARDRTAAGSSTAATAQ